MTPKDFDAFSELLLTLADYYGRKLAPATIQLYWNALAAFDFEVIQALCTEHVRTQKFMPSIAELLDAVKAMDGRPSAEEAWAMVAKCLNDEGATVVWTEEMASAFGVALGLRDDRIAARMAFKEAYAREVQEARRAHRPVKWTASLGHDVGGREGVLIEAARLNRLPVEYVRGLLLNLTLNDDVLRLVNRTLDVKAA